MRSQSTFFGSVVVMDSMFASELNQRRTDVMKRLLVVPVFFGELILIHACKAQNLLTYHSDMPGIIMADFLKIFENNGLIFDGHPFQTMQTL